MVGGGIVGPNWSVLFVAARIPCGIVGQIPKHPNTWYRRYTILVSQFQAQYQHPNGCKELTVKILKTELLSLHHPYLRKMPSSQVAASSTLRKPYLPRMLIAEKLLLAISYNLWSQSCLLLLSQARRRWHVMGSVFYGLALCVCRILRVVVWAVVPRFLCQFSS